MTPRARDLSPAAVWRLAKVCCETGSNYMTATQAPAVMLALSAENERLRAVLSPLVNHPLFHDREYLSQELNEKLDAARAALPEGDQP